MGLERKIKELFEEFLTYARNEVEDEVTDLKNEKEDLQEEIVQLQQQIEELRFGR